MRRKDVLTFHEVEQAITSPVTKFGGLPVWLTEPQWPLSASSGNPMRFICQIALDPAIFGTPPEQMAYLFMTDDDEDDAATFDPESGENAVIIQPGGICTLPTEPLTSGPLLYKMADDFLAKHTECEFTVTLTPGEDPDELDEDEQAQASDESWQEFTAYWDENKIGGTPAFLQGPEYPRGEGWRLLLQLSSTDLPFYLNLGDAGNAYAFLSEDGTSGKFLWQCL